MKNLLIVVVAVVAIAVAAYFYTKKPEVKTVSADGTPAPLPPAPVTPPAVNSGAVSMFDGAGKTAIDERIREIRNSSNYFTLMNSTGAANKIFSGIQSERFKSDFLKANGITTPDTLLMPDLSNTGFFAAVKRLQDFKVPVSDTWANIFTLIDISKQMDERGNVKAVKGTPDDLKFGLFQSYKGYGRKASDSEFRTAQNACFPDFARLSKNITEAADIVSAGIRKQAVADLRAAGWKFVGID